MDNVSTCPHCYGQSSNIGQVQITRLLFLIHYVRDSTEQVIGCPRCLRRLIWNRTWSNMLAANILFPIVVYFNGLEYYKTYRDERIAEGLLHRSLTDDDIRQIKRRRKKQELLASIFFVMAFFLFVAFCFAFLWWLEAIVQP
jgi:hypothetical protein